MYLSQASWQQQQQDEQDLRNDNMSFATLRQQQNQALVTQQAALYSDIPNGHSGLDSIMLQHQSRQNNTNGTFAGSSDDCVCTLGGMGSCPTWPRDNIPGFTLRGICSDVQGAEENDVGPSPRPTCKKRRRRHDGRYPLQDEYVVGRTAFENELGSPWLASSGLLHDPIGIQTKIPPLEPQQESLSPRSGDFPVLTPSHSRSTMLSDCSIDFFGRCPEDSSLNESGSFNVLAQQRGFSATNLTPVTSKEGSASDRVVGKASAMVGGKDENPGLLREINWSNNLNFFNSDAQYAEEQTEAVDTFKNAYLGWEAGLIPPLPPYSLYQPTQGARFWNKYAGQHDEGQILPENIRDESLSFPYEPCFAPPNNPSPPVVLNNMVIERADSLPAEYHHRPQRKPQSRKHLNDRRNTRQTNLSAVRSASSVTRHAAASPAPPAGCPNSTGSRGKRVEGSHLSEDYRINAKAVRDWMTPCRSVRLEKRYEHFLPASLASKVSIASVRGFLHQPISPSALKFLFRLSIDFGEPWIFGAVKLVLESHDPHQILSFHPHTAVKRHDASPITMDEAKGCVSEPQEHWQRKILKLICSSEHGFLCDSGATRKTQSSDLVLTPTMRKPNTYDKRLNLHVTFECSKCFTGSPHIDEDLFVHTGCGMPFGQNNSRLHQDVYEPCEPPRHDEAEEAPVGVTSGEERDSVDTIDPIESNEDTVTIGQAPSPKKSMIQRFVDSQPSIVTGAVSLDAEDGGDTQTASSDQGYHDGESFSERNIYMDDELSSNLSIVAYQKKRILKNIMEEFNNIFFSSASSSFYCHGESSHNGTASNTANPPASSGQGPRGRSSISAGKKRALDRGLSSEGEGDGNQKRHKRTLSSFSPSGRARLLACPFNKYDPKIYSPGNESQDVAYKFRCCGGPGWPTVARLKEHLYRVHSIPIQCARCWLTMKTEKDLEEHVRAQSPCRIQPQLVRWIPREKIGVLKDRKKVLGQTEVDRWKLIYGILFPDDLSFPSAYYDDLEQHCQSDTPLSPLSRVHAAFERYLQDNLPRRVEQSIEAMLDEQLLPVEESLKRALPEVVRTCTAQIFRDWERHSSGVVQDIGGESFKKKLDMDDAAGQDNQDDPALPELQQPVEAVSTFYIEPAPISFENTDDRQVQFKKKVLGQSRTIADSGYGTLCPNLNMIHPKPPESPRLPNSAYNGKAFSPPRDLEDPELMDRTISEDFSWDDFIAEFGDCQAQKVGGGVLGEPRGRELLRIGRVSVAWGCLGGPRRA